MSRGKQLDGKKKRAAGKAGKVEQMKEIKGIEKVVEESQNLRGYESGFYLQLNYNQETGEVWTDEIVDYSHNSYVRYDNPNIIGCADLCMPVTAERVRELVADIEK